MPQNPLALEIHPDGDELARAAAHFIAGVASRSISARGTFSLALAGGSTPRATYELLADKSLAEDIGWSRVHVFWSDERCVPPEHPDSNYNMVRQALLDKIPVPSENVHRIRGELPPEQAATEYQIEAESVLGQEPRFDLVLLGMGEDGHTASLFPGTSALEEMRLPVVAVYVERLQAWRVTLTLPTINRARQVRFLVSGSTKAPALARVLAGEQLPAALVQPSDGELVWMVDGDAAAAVQPNKAA